VLTVAAVADHKGIHTERIQVRVERYTATDSPWHTSFTIHLDLGGGLTPRERAILSNSARKCEVYKMLTGVVEFSYHCE